MQIYFSHASVQDQEMMDTIKSIHNEAMAKLKLKNLSEEQLSQMKAYKLEVVLNSRMKSRGGTASFNRLTRKLKIEINYKLHQANPNQIKDTYIHELGHIVDFYFFESSSHGYRWQAITSSMGGSIARTHQMDTSAFKRKQTKYNYSCACTTHKISAIKHNKIQRGFGYRCIKCQQSLKLLAQAVSA